MVIPECVAESINIGHCKEAKEHPILYTSKRRAREQGTEAIGVR